MFNQYLTSSSHKAIVAQVYINRWSTQVGFILSIFTLSLNILTADCLCDTAKMQVVETITTLIVMNYEL